MKRIMMALAAGLAIAAPAAAQEAQVPEIVVTGEGEVAAVPDMAMIRLGVSREARLATAAMDDASAAAAAVLTRLEGAGIAARDIQTSNIALHPRFQHFNDGTAPRVTGYVATNDLSVRVRDLDALGGVLDAVVGDGANTMSGLQFQVADPAPLENEARVKAVADARAKAETLAEAAGVALGPVRRISQSGGPAEPMPAMRGMAMAEAAVPVAEGEVTVRQSVTVIFGIAE